MRKNIHPVERLVRMSGGAFLTSLAFWGPKKKFFLLGLIPLATGSFGTCPLYSAFQISSHPKDAQLSDIKNFYHPVSHLH